MDHHGVIVDQQYRLLERAGRGGMAQVWRAEPLASSRPSSAHVVALKRILPGLAGDHAVHALFADEARITATLDHPNIVRFEGSGCDAAGPYLALEWVDGMTLRELITARPEGLHEAAVVAIGVDVLNALGAAHEHRPATRADARTGRSPVIHRDVSPSNVLVGADGVTKLSDFGLARSLSHPRTNPRGTARGKAAYLPPEVLAGGPHGIRGDLYSVGAVLWEALTGRGLFEGSARDPRVARAMLRDPRPAVRGHCAAVSPAVAEVIDRAVAHDPAFRYASARGMASALTYAIGASGRVVDRSEVEAAVRDARASRGDDAEPSDAPEGGPHDAVVAELLASTLAAIAG